MLPYFFLVFATLLYAVGFTCNRNVEKDAGTDFFTTVLFATVTWTEIFLVLCAVNGGLPSFTPFSFVLACIQSSLILLNFFLSLRAISGTDLTKYSLYMMLGGMLIPFLFGMILWGDSITLAKILCCLLIVTGLITDSRVSRAEACGEKKKGGRFYLYAIFTVNGTFGVLATLQQQATRYERVDAISYMMLMAILLAGFGLVYLAVQFFRRRVKGIALPTYGKKAFLWMMAYGLAFGSAELTCLFTLQNVEPSAQYPLVSGGTIVFSTLIGMLLGENRDRRRLIPVGISVAGILCLLLPI